MIPFVTTPQEQQKGTEWFIVTLSHAKLCMFAWIPVALLMCYFSPQPIGVGRGIFMFFWPVVGAMCSLGFFYPLLSLLAMALRHRRLSDAVWWAAYLIGDAVAVWAILYH